MHISDLVPQPGERHAVFGGTRAGKSGFQDWSLREIQASRPDAMQILIDTKPRFRAETEKGLRPQWRHDASHRYQSWAKGPVVPNSVVVDIWNDKPFAGTFQRPGEVVILQSGEAADWKRILTLLDAFVKANINGRERRIIVDECLDFMSVTPGLSIQRTMYFSARLEQVGKETSVLTWVLIKCRDYRVWSVKCSQESRYFTCVMMMQT
jgi:hypothetical protein